MQDANAVIATAGFVPFSGRATFDDIPLRNQLLASLSAGSLASLKPHIETRHLEQNEVLFEAGQPVTHVYFPESAGVSLVSVVEGRPTMAGTVGHEGMVGIGLFLGQETSPHCASTHLPGTSRRMAATVFRQLVTVAGPLHELMLRYAHMFLAQVIETHQCNAAHLVEQRCAHWVLLTSHRADAAEFPLELELLALVMEVRRGGVSLGLRALEQGGLIEYRRNRVRILNRRALEEVACKCTWAIPEE